MKLFIFSSAIIFCFFCTILFTITVASYSYDLAKTHAIEEKEFSYKGQTYQVNTKEIK